MPTALETAQALASKRRTIESGTDRQALENHLNTTLSSFAGVNGISRALNKLTQNLVEIASANVVMHQWAPDCSDNALPLTVEGYVIVWQVKRFNGVVSGFSRTVEEFNNEFGRAMARYV